MKLTQQKNNAVLGLVGVLIFVDENVLEAFLVRAQNFGVLFKQTHHVHQEVVEVHSASAQHSILIFGVDLCFFACTDMRCGIKRNGRRDQFVFPQTDGRLRFL